MIENMGHLLELETSIDDNFHLSSVFDLYVTN
jgi:hypothetical protein